MVVNNHNKIVLVVIKNVLVQILHLNNNNNQEVDLNKIVVVIVLLLLVIVKINKPMVKDKDNERNEMVVKIAAVDEVVAVEKEAAKHVNKYNNYHTH
jgi:hypothetical protein